uniref:Uncharacterized protein n=1 Tax=Anguilla anguilla TaxID=7936 RepID=A0A0E9XRE9_ANGAN
MEPTFGWTRAATTTGNSIPQAVTKWLHFEFEEWCKCFKNLSRS